jgi:vacuolar-type H+-ATPase subunit E/Vma4
MSAREKIIDECFTKAQHELSILKGEYYERLVRKLIRDGQEKLGRNCTALTTRDVDKKIAKDLGINITGTVESSGGIVLKSADGKVILDHTFDGILKREKNQIRIKVGKLLFS